MNTLEMVSHETMVFMRGKYRLDEIGDGKDELKFKQGQKTILLYLSVTEGSVGGLPLKGLVTGASKVVGGRIIFICL